METFVSRKFILVLIGMAMSTAMLLLDKITSADYVYLNGALGVAYLTANAFSGHSKRKHTNSNNDFS